MITTEYAAITNASLVWPLKDLIRLHYYVKVNVSVSVVVVSSMTALAYVTSGYASSHPTSTTSSQPMLT